MPRNLFPEVVAAVPGYELDPVRGFFSVVVPLGVDQTNRMTNSSFEVDYTGWSTHLGAGLARVTTEHKFGAASLQVTPGVNPSSGVIVSNTTSWVLTSGTPYFFSTWIKGAQNHKYRIWVDNGSGPIAGLSFVTTGAWQRVVCPFSAVGSVQHYGFIDKDDVTSDTVPFYVDGAQLEANYLTTYIDGDQRGFVRGAVEYYWSGVAHASTSVRIAQCGAGGKVVPLSYLGFRLLAISGLGLGGLIHQLQPLALGGAFYQGTVTGDRQFSLVGQLEGESLMEVQRKRRALIDVFKPDRVVPDQPVRLLYEPTDDCGQVIGRQLEIDCLFEDGLAGNADNLFQERLGLTFRLYLPYTARESGDNTASLNLVSTLTTHHVAQRSIAGQWAIMGTGANDAVTTLIRLNDGSIVAGGSFGNMAGLANTKAIARWDGTAWNAMGTGASGGAVLALALGPDGSLYAGGTFALMGGVAGTVGIARWDGTAWNAIGTTGVDAGKYVAALTVDTEGQVWAGGNFATMDSVANTLRLAVWNGTVWEPFGTGANGIVRVLLAGTPWITPGEPFVYIGGDFTQIKGSPAVGIALLQDAGPGQVYELGANGVEGVTSGTVQVNALALFPDGTLYAGGEFDEMGGVANTIGLARWNGWTEGNWTALGTGLSSGAVVYGLTYDSYTRQLLVAGNFTTAGGRILLWGLEGWNGSVWTDIDIYSLGTGLVPAIALGTPEGRLFLGTLYSVDTSATIAGVTSVTNNGDAPTTVKIIFTGSGQLRYIRNATTRKVIYFNYNLLDGETATLDLTGPQVTFVSSMFGNVMNRISGGSQLTEFGLQPGINSLTVFMGGVGVNASTTLVWQNRYHSIDGAIFTPLVP